MNTKDDPTKRIDRFLDYFTILPVDMDPNGIVVKVRHIVSEHAKIETLKQQDAEFREATRARPRLDGNVVLTDFRDVDRIPSGNRFLLYTLFPQSNVSVRVHWGPSKEHVACALGHSIFNRTCRTAVGHSILNRTCRTAAGQLMSDYGGGGHAGAGTCLLPAAEADRKLAEISPIEHAVMWIGAYELQFCHDVPWRVVLNECIELAKSFGGTDGHKYVNAVLNGLAAVLRAAEVAADCAAGRAPAKS